jgi:hypothetical protein
MSRARVYPRDASAYDRPNVRTPKRLHWPRSGDDDALSACGLPICTGFAEHHGDMGADPAAVPAGLRCQRPGCRQRWAPPAAQAYQTGADQ